MSVYIRSGPTPIFNGDSMLAVDNFVRVALFPCDEFEYYIYVGTININ